MTLAKLAVDAKKETPAAFAAFLNEEMGHHGAGGSKPPDCSARNEAYFAGGLK